MLKQFFQPYFEAVKKILEGTPVENLDDIRDQCNNAFMRTVPENARDKVHGYTTDALFITFTADAENRILMGKDPVEAYRVASFNDLDLYRQNSRKFLDNYVQQYAN